MFRQQIVKIQNRTCFVIEKKMQSSIQLIDWYVRNLINEHFENKSKICEMPRNQK